VAVIAPATLTATGWADVDGSGRYFSHAARFGPAIFDRNEVDALENRHERKSKPRRASACRCRLPYGRLEELICWKYGRRVR
jgi:hypothetical protein